MPIQRDVWTDEKIAELKRLRASGKKFQECADAMGLAYVQLAHQAYRKYVRKEPPRYFGTDYDLVGQKFGKLTVVSKIKKPRFKHGSWFMWRCLCECGIKKTYSTRDLIQRTPKSCGCAKIKHGMTGTPTFGSWQSMLQRCRDKENKDYGGREIPVTVCERWQGEHGFVNFLADLGKRPKGLTLDRQNPFGNYEPGNCCWSNAKQQSLNQRRHYPKPGEPGYVDPFKQEPEPGPFEGDEVF